MVSEVMYSSATDVWSTPPWFFQALDNVFHFGLDVCALPDNHKCPHYFTPEQDGLKQDWTGHGAVWMNPPYGREISKWIEKAWTSSKQGTTVVCLVPARVDTRWFQNYCLNAEVFFVRGRLKFGNAESCAPFPSAVVCFRPQIADAFKPDQTTLFDEE